MEDNKRVEYPFNNPDCPEFDTCFELKIAMSQKEKDDQKGEITKDVIFQTAGGSPLGVYPTLADIQTAYDTGEIDSTKGVYLSMDDGFWNYYDHKLNKWVKGKLYQGTAVNPEDPTIIDLANKIQGNQDYTSQVESDLNKHIENANAKFEIIEKVQDNHNDRLNQVENELHETEVVEVKENYKGNRINVPTSAEVEGRNFQTINNQLYKVSGIKGQTKTSSNLIPYPYYTSDKTINGVTFTTRKDGTIVLNGTSTDYVEFPIIDYNPAKVFDENNNLFLSGCPKNKGIELLWFYPSQRYIDTGNGVVIPKGAMLRQLEIFINPNYTFSNFEIKPMLNIGSSAFPHKPYFKGLQNTTITNITSIGANRWNEKWEQGIISNGNNVPNAQHIRTIEYTKIDLTKKYYFNYPSNYSNLKVEFYNSNKEYIDWKGPYSAGIQIEPYPNSKYIKFSINVGDGTYHNDIILSVGKTYEYVPYKTDKTKDIKLVLKGVGEVTDEAILTNTKDTMGKPTELYEVDVLRKFNKETLNLGTLDWNYWDTPETNEYYSNALVSLIKQPLTTTEKANITCSKYKTLSRNSQDQNKTESISVLTNGFILIVDKQKLTPEKFKKYLLDNGVELVYELATPTQEPKVSNLSLGDVSVLGQWGGEFQINPIEPNVVEPKETSFNFDIRYWEQPTNKGGNL